MHNNTIYSAQINKCIIFLKLAIKGFFSYCECEQEVSTNMRQTHIWMNDLLPGCICTARQTTCGDRHALTVTT